MRTHLSRVRCDARHIWVFYLTRQNFKDLVPSKHPLAPVRDVFVQVFMFAHAKSGVYRSNIITVPSFPFTPLYILPVPLFPPLSLFSCSPFLSPTPTRPACYFFVQGPVIKFDISTGIKYAVGEGEKGALLQSQGQL